MKQYALTLDLKDDPALIEAYKQHHQQVWPQVIASLKQVGVLDMQIYCHGNRLFMLSTTVDDYEPQRAYEAYLQLDPACREWEALMDQFQQRLPGALPDEKWLPMECCFDMQKC
uniref:L-rhamnose mutarotase n=1 Tax=Marinobacterium profundum TaxID=1714300 RepID=UPI000829BA8A|nr:L-rhamnose mutarotase [Marinobacterium profundum]